MDVRRLILFAVLGACLALASPAWAGSLLFRGTNFPDGQGLLSFTPGIGNDLTVGPGGGFNGGPVTDFMNTYGICGGDCSITGGYLQLASGPETSGSAGGGTWTYLFGSGGNIKIFGEIPILGINSPTLLMTASFASGSFTGAGTVGSFIGGINLASIVLAPQLGVYKYSGASTDVASFNITDTCSTGGSCSGSIVDAATTLQTIPEPATLSVLGVGLFAFGTGLRRRMAANKTA